MKFVVLINNAEIYIDDLLVSNEKLKKHPEFCAPCRNLKLREKGYRCCLFKQHISAIDKKQVKILAVIHSKRNPDTVLYLLQDS